jgi:serine/threonine protein kinase
MADVSTHPTARALALFGHGKLSAAQAASVAAHLEICAECRQHVAGLAADSFLDKVRASKPDGTVALSDSPRSSPAPAAAAVNGLPPELANHPKFRIIRELGRGGMGVIYLAEHRVLEKPVALKVISPAVLDNPQALSRFQAEVKAAGKLDHQNIARAYDADQAGELHFLVMEFVEGQSLAQLLERKGQLPVTAACHCACQAALGLQHAFEKGMAHRDIKPQNLMLTPKGQVKVLDFGLARLRGERKRAGLTQADSFMGTPEYVAPEQAADARQADTRADIYSLGCTLYALLAGRPPFQEDTVVKLVLAHIEQEPRPLHELRPDVPPELSAVVAKMLAKDPARRFQRPVEVAQALAPFTKPGAKPARPSPPAVKDATADPPAASTQDDSEPAPRKSRREREPEATEPEVGAPPGKVWKPATVAVGVVFVVVAVAAGAFLLLRGTGRETAATGPALAEDRPGSDKRPPLPPATGRATEGQRDVEPADTPAADIDPDPAGPVGEVRQFTGHTGGIRRLAVSPDGRRILTASFDKTFRLWDVAGGRELRQWDGHAGEAVHGAVFLPDGNRVLTCGKDKSVHLWDLKSGRIIRSFTGHTQGVWQVAVSGDGRLAASCGSESTVFFWDVETGKVLHRLEGNEGGVEMVTLSGDGRLALTGSMKGPIRLWDAEKGTELRRFPGHADFVLGLAFLPGNKLLLSAGTDRTVRLWDVEGGKEVRQFQGLSAGVTSATLSPDGKQALTGCEDGTVRLWDVQTGKELHHFQGPKEIVWTVAFSPDGRHAYSAGNDQVVRMWRLPSPGYVPPAPKETPPVVKRPETKAAVPDEAALAAAEQEVKEVHKAEYAKKKPAEVQALAGRLLKEGLETKDKPAARFVLLREARDLAVRAGDLVLAMQAADEMANHFAVDAVATKTAALERAQRGAGSAAAHLNIIAVAWAVADGAAEADQYESAERLARLAVTSAGSVSSSPLLAAAQARLKEATALVKAYEPVPETLWALPGKPDDPGANLAVGKFYALAKGDWDRGLAPLARGDDARLKALAEADLSPPGGGGAALALAERYRAQAESETGPERTHILARACYWYGVALNGSSGIDRAKAEKRIAELDKTLPASQPVVLHARYGADRGWLDLTDRARMLLHARWQKSGVKIGVPELELKDDPAPGEHKSLVVVYRYRGGAHLSITGDAEKASRPAPAGQGDTEPGKLAPGQEMVVLYARFGNEGTYADVTAKAQAAVRGRTLATSPPLLQTGDPYFGRRKAFIVVYRDSGRVGLSTTGQEDAVQLGADAGKP